MEVRHAIEPGSESARVKFLDDELSVPRRGAARRARSPPSIRGGWRSPALSGARARAGEEERKISGTVDGGSLASSHRATLDERAS